ncbi:uncharacterized protein K489DRAFT_385246 [Dissoconium aciculare CBS 342.82]|uniref:Uncharacterized protein n=1 Tax=Dissoconium aciculare CBS 342.82 TaxID=1314786 RepID=A0A6J3LS63_9PEZI|nr:uncharacterized protein K489DRAFT_385246 [Dissoconium aciculare CBS 342.82]KAF1818129.1 hypothetical protein K489DRAFT_385246 [Dissoconium aciculare CBS 342.82]
MIVPSHVQPEIYPFVTSAVQCSAVQCSARACTSVMESCAFSPLHLIAAGGFKVQPTVLRSAGTLIDHECKTTTVYPGSKDKGMAARLAHVHDMDWSVATFACDHRPCSRSYTPSSPAVLLLPPLLRRRQCGGSMHASYLPFQSRLATSSFQGSFDGLDDSGQADRPRLVGNVAIHPSSYYTGPT